MNTLCGAQFAVRSQGRSSARLILAAMLMLPACACTTMSAGGGMAPIVGAPNLQNPAVTVRVMPGDTMGVISRRHGVPVQAILAANNLTSANNLRVGQSLRIPASVATPSNFAALSPETPAQPSVADMAMRPARTIPQVDAPQKAVLPRQAIERHGEMIVSPRMTSLAQPALKPQGFAANVANLPMSGMGGPLLAAKPKQVAAIDPGASVISTPGASATPGQPGDFTATNTFIWPVSGRLLSSFGEMENGFANDGVNIEVTEGVGIKASDNGVVIYSGNQLARFGKLLLIKHSNGFVTAYAHNAKLLVQKGDKVRQGQIIAKGGRTAEVNKPQIHFEIRRGDKPVDPKRYVGGGVNASL